MQKIVRTINIEIERVPETCFDCPFSKKEYCWATCHFLQETREDGMAPSKNCPLKPKNRNKKYTFTP